MSTQEPTRPARKRGAPTKAAKKLKRNMSLNASTIKAGERMAFAEKMSFSAWTDRLIREKHAELMAAKTEGVSK